MAANSSSSTKPAPSGLSPKISLFFSRLKDAFVAAETRLSAMPRRRIVLLVLALALGFALLGVVFGIVLTPYNPTSTPPLDSETSTGDEQLASFTGIVRALSEPKEGSSYYLQLEGGNRILLKSTNFDIAFFKDASVTARGVAASTADGNEQVLFVKYVQIK
ncbi:hypothetical protein A2V54_01755 [candidate division WWE3 bacterium RBG_19FT_COMBO_53_11]|uniref:Uncharacterized protein n=1 Tax=candidate division WWE3 bacterium RBG_19FT_COMBO_53_11 TaxID=1802613 RepID=A0A1F4UIH4_UNCKA|nr:MAG: hypothetical protein A2155_01795 [candidate division WWE3 bacterium RBG_16_52_45]OGC44775.1 MAG: hypothetical protein A2V54_01755 [candidate division WWE3 bacterium RBG_19FT_COMBO_53_11]